MESEWTIEDFLSAASKRLDLFPTAKRIFNADGVEIDDCMMIVDNDLLFLSDGAKFQPPSRMRKGVESDGHLNIDDDEDNDDGKDGSSVTGGKAMEGENIGGFRVGKVLGRGAFGEVRMGKHHLTGERVALKFLRKSEILTIGAAERTATEIQCLDALKHNNIIQLLTQLESPLNVVFVFELMEGGDLYGYLCARGTTPQQMSLPEEEARPLFHQILSAVGYAHNQHICHRDLKLENILLKGVNSLALVKIADFGLSDFYRPGVNKKSYCGTLSFLAPEVFKGTSNAGPPLDIWSMGVILFAILCGRLPFDAHTTGANSDKPRETIIRNKILACQYKIDEKLGPEAKDLVRRMLKVDPNERASVPEIFNHVWLRSMSNSLIDFSPGDRVTMGGSSVPFAPGGRGVGNISRPNSGVPLVSRNIKSPAIPILTASPIPIPGHAPDASSTASRDNDRDKDKDIFVDSLSQMEDTQHGVRATRAISGSFASSGKSPSDFVDSLESRLPFQLQDSLDVQVGANNTGADTPVLDDSILSKCNGIKSSSYNESNRSSIGDTMDEFVQAADANRQSPSNTPSFLSDAFESGVRSRVSSGCSATPPVFSNNAGLSVSTSVGSGDGQMQGQGKSSGPSVIFPSFRLMPLRRNTEQKDDCDSDDDPYPVTSGVTSATNSCLSSPNITNKGFSASPPTTTRHADDKFRRSMTSTAVERKTSQSSVTSNGTSSAGTPADSRCITPNSTRHSLGNNSNTSAGGFSREKGHRNSYGNMSRSTTSKLSKQSLLASGESTTPMFSTSKRFDSSSVSPVNNSSSTAGSVGGRPHRDSDPGFSHGSFVPKRR